MAVAQVPVLCVTAAVASTLVVAVRKIIQLRTKKGSTRCIAVVQPEGKIHFKAVLLPLSGVIAQQCLAKSSSLQYTSVLGIDCEWQPEKGRSHSPVSLLQFAPSEDTCFLAQLLYMDSMPEQIRSVLQDPLVIKVHEFSNLPGWSAQQPQQHPAQQDKLFSSFPAAFCSHNICKSNYTGNLFHAIHRSA